MDHSLIISRNMEFCVSYVLTITQLQYIRLCPPPNSIWNCLYWIESSVAQKKGYALLRTTVCRYSGHPEPQKNSKKGGLYCKLHPSWLAHTFQIVILINVCSYRYRILCPLNSERRINILYSAKRTPQTRKPLFTPLRPRSSHRHGSALPIHCLSSIHCLRCEASHWPQTSQSISPSRSLTKATSPSII